VKVHVTSKNKIAKRSKAVVLQEPAEGLGGKPGPVSFGKMISAVFQESIVDVIAVNDCCQSIFGSCGSIDEGKASIGFWFGVAMKSSITLFIPFCANKVSQHLGFLTLVQR